MKIYKEVKSLRLHVGNLHEIEDSGIVDENIHFNTVLFAVFEQPLVSIGFGKVLEYRLEAERWILLSQLGSYGIELLLLVAHKHHIDALFGEGTAKFESDSR